MPQGEKPVPVPDDASAGYWAAAARHELALPRCRACGTYSLPPTLVCGGCATTDPQYEYVKVDGAGRVRSWTIVRDAFLPGFAADVPYVLVDVELDAQPELRMIGRLTAGADVRLHLDARVAIAFDDIAPGVAVPAFAPVDA